jgi:hypothetical protein
MDQYQKKQRAEAAGFHLGFLFETCGSRINHNVAKKAMETLPAAINELLEARSAEEEKKPNWWSDKKPQGTETKS